MRALVIDKTGTLTLGQARLVETQVADAIAPDELLRLAASLDQASKHIIAQTLVAEAARASGLKLAIPSEVVETPGEGIAGTGRGPRGRGRRLALCREQDRRRTCARSPASGSPARWRWRWRSTASPPAC